MSSSWWDTLSGRATSLVTNVTPYVVSGGKYIVSLLSPSDEGEGVSVTSHGRDKLFSEYGTRCFCCGISLEEKSIWHRGHVVARKYGGTAKIHNLRPVCVECNLDMKCLHMFEYIIERNFSHGVRNIKEHPLFAMMENRVNLRKKLIRILQKMASSGRITPQKSNKLILEIRDRSNPHLLEEHVLQIHRLLTKFGMV